jgi:hypothetical protein
MKNLNYNILLAVVSIFFISLIFSGCENSGKVTGTVVDGISNQPVSNVLIIAETSVNIVEDKKYERSTSKCNDKGEFLLQGLSPKYNYKITAVSQGYTIGDATAIPPDKGQTYMLQKPLKIIKIPPSSGSFAYSENNFSSLTKVNFKKINGRYDWDRTYDYTESIQNIIAADKMIVFYGEYSQYLNIYPLTYFDGDVTLPFSNNSSVTLKANNILIAGANPPDLRKFIYYNTNADRFNAPSGTLVGEYGFLSGTLPSYYYDHGNLTIQAIDVSYLKTGIYSIKQGREVEGWLFKKL